jgi:hypothetical protein
MVSGAPFFQAFVMGCVYVLKLVNEAVVEPYMARAFFAPKE